MISWLPNEEFLIPAAPTVNGQSWTRVTATNYNDVGGWAFTFRTSNRIRARLFDNVLVGSEPTAKPSAYTLDLFVDTTNNNVFTHDEPDICWNPSTRQIMVCWNNRTNTANIMDQRYRVFNEAGQMQMPTDALATHKTLESQWRPIIEAYDNRWLLSFTGNHKDSAFFTMLNAFQPFDFYENYPALMQDVQMAPVIGINRQVSQHAISLPDGRILCAWDEVAAYKGRVRYRLFNADFTPASNNFVELPLQLTYGKSEPRIACNGNKIWIVYHHETRGGEYFGIEVYAIVLQYDSVLGTLSVVKPEFPVHPTILPGLKLKPELVMVGDRVVVVFEHFPDGYVDTSVSPITPVYVTPNGYSQIKAVVFNTDGRALTRPVRIDSVKSTGLGTAPYSLRPDIALSYDESEIMVCWTSANLTSNNQSIYSIPSGSPSRLWARVINVSNLP